MQGSDCRGFERTLNMKNKIAIIGPGRLLNKVIRKMDRLMGLKNKLVAVCITDQGQVDPGIPVYRDWREMVRSCGFDYLAMLSRDLDLKVEIRRNLPARVDLVEFVPAMEGARNLLAMIVYKRKREKKAYYLESLVEALPFAAMIFNRHGTLTHWNSICERMTGLKAMEVVGKKHAGRAFHPNERPLAGQMLLNDFKLSEYREFFPGPELEIELKPDSVMIKGFMGLKTNLRGYYQIICRKIIMDGQVIGAIELLQDLNPLFLLEEEAIRKQVMLRSIVNHLPFPMIQTGKDGLVVFVNEAAAAALEELSPSRKDGSYLNIFFALPELKEEFIPFIQGLSHGRDDVCELETKFSRNVYWGESEWEVTCLRPPGQVAELIWIIRSVSARENEIQFNTALAIVGTICHELSQPITAVINSSRILSGIKPQDRPQDRERAEKFMRIISEQGDLLEEKFKKLQNITRVRLQKYLDTQILDLDESTGNMKPRISLPDHPDD
jgi:PAS domain-containing protein